MPACIQQQEWLPVCHALSEPHWVTLLHIWKVALILCCWAFLEALTFCYTVTKQHIEQLTHFMKLGHWQHFPFRLLGVINGPLCVSTKVRATPYMPATCCACECVSIQGILCFTKLLYDLPNFGFWSSLKLDFPEYTIPHVRQSVKPQTEG